jgi:hypothetical protein
MRRRPALSLFLGTCVVLALLLVTGAIRPVVAGGLFAIALVAFGGLSRGFTRS